MTDRKKKGQTPTPLEGTLIKSRVGRKPKYTPDIPGRVIELMKNFNCVVEVAADLGISRNTLYRWAKENTELAEALEEGKTAFSAGTMKLIKASALGDKSVNMMAVDRLAKIAQLIENDNVGGNTTNQTFNIENMNYNNLSELSYKELKERADRLAKDNNYFKVEDMKDDSEDSDV